MEVQQLKVKVGLIKSTVIPAWVVDSGSPGPVVLLCAAQHGNEVQGSEAIRRFVTKFAPRLTSGKLFAVPVCNPLAVQQRRPHIGMQAEQAYERDGGLNMNRTWPGDPKGKKTHKMAHAIYEAFGAEATHVIDLHCWQKHWAPGILLHDLHGHRELAAQLGQRFIHIRPMSENTLAGYFGSTGRMGITLEISGQYTLIEEQIENAVMLIERAFRVIGGAEVEPIDGPVLFSDKITVSEVDAPGPGIFRPEPLKFGQEVQAGQLLGTIMSDKSLEDVQVIAPKGGYIQCLGVSRPNCDVSMTGHHPYVTKGDRVAALWSRV